MEKYPKSISPMSKFALGCSNHGKGEGGGSMKVCEWKKELMHWLEVSRKN